MKLNKEHALLTGWIPICNTLSLDKLNFCDVVGRFFCLFMGGVIFFAG
jgi:hypothetical protein